MRGKEVGTAVSVILCTRNRARLLRRVLEALSGQTLPQENIELIVVDDGSDGAGAAPVCEEMRPRLPGLRCLPTGAHIGLAAARDVGVRAAKTERLLFIDDDCVPAPDWAHTLAAALGKHPLVAGAVDTPLDNPVRLCHNIAEFYGVMPCRKAGPITFLAGANMALARAVVEDVGGFGDQKVPGEDIGFALRAVERGYTPWFAPEAVVTHRPDRTTMKEILAYSARHAAATILIRNSHRRTLRTPLVLRSAPLLILSAPLLALAVTVRIYRRCPPLRRFWWTAPAVYALKLAWCAGAAAGLWKTMTERTGRA